MPSDDPPPRPKPGEAFPHEREPVIIEARAVEIDPPAAPAPAAAGDEPAPVEAAVEPDAPPPGVNPPPPPVPRQGPGGLILTLAGLGVATLTMTAGYFWLENRNSNAARDLLQGDLGAMSARVAAAEKGVADLAKSTQPLAALDKRLAAVEQKPAPADMSAGVAALEKRAAGLESALQATRAAATSASALESRLAALEAARAPANAEVRDAPRPESTESTVVAELEKRFAALEARLPKSAPRPENPDAAAPAPSPDISGLVRRLDALESAQGRVSAAPPVDLAPLTGRIGAIDARLDALEKALTAPKADARVTEAPVARAPKERDNGALAVVAQSILTALERGSSFAPELAAAENLGADPASLAPLKPLAGAGVPAAPRLAAAFRAVSSATLAAAAPPPPATAGVLDQLGAAASKLVKVRPVGDTAGDDPAALLGRIESALERGRVADALSLWEKLPAPARKASEGWAVEARKRTAGETAARAVFTAAIGELAKTKSAP